MINIITFLIKVAVLIFLIVPIYALLWIISTILWDKRYVDVCRCLLNIFFDKDYTIWTKK